MFEDLFKWKAALSEFSSVPFLTVVFHDVNSELNEQLQ